MTLKKASNLVPKYLTHKSQSYPCNQFSPLVTPTTSTINKVYLSTYLPHSVILVKARNSPLWMYQHRPLGTARFFFHLLHIFFPKPAFSSGGDDCLLHVFITCRFEIPARNRSKEGDIRPGMLLGCMSSSQVLLRDQRDQRGRLNWKPNGEASVDHSLFLITIALKQIDG